MRTETKTYYDESDFKKVEESMCLRNCISYLKQIANEYFTHYSYPYDGEEVSIFDYDDYKNYCAIQFAINQLGKDLKNAN